MEETKRSTGRRGARLLFFALPLLLVGALWVQRRREAPPPPPRDDTIAGLKTRLGGDEDDALDAQAELERRVGVKDTLFWKGLLDSPRSRARYLAADTLSKQKTPEVASLLAGLMQDSASEVRLCAVQALGSAEQ